MKINLNLSASEINIIIRALRSQRSGEEQNLNLLSKENSSEQGIGIKILEELENQLIHYLKSQPKDFKQVVLEEEQRLDRILTNFHGSFAELTKKESESLLTANALCQRENSLVILAYTRGYLRQLIDDYNQRRA